MTKKIAETLSKELGRKVEYLRISPDSHNESYYVGRVGWVNIPYGSSIDTVRDAINGRMRRTFMTRAKEELGRLNEQSN